jgi:hypothetical protein
MPDEINGAPKLEEFKSYIEIDGSVNYDTLMKYVNQKYSDVPKECDVRVYSQKRIWKCQPLYTTFKLCRCRMKVHDEYDINDEHYIICNNMYRVDTERHSGNCGCAYDKKEKRCKAYMAEWYYFNPEEMACISVGSALYCGLCCACMCCCCGSIEESDELKFEGFEKK